MKTKEWEKVYEIVLDALEVDEARRLHFVRERCLDQPEMRREIESLLAGESAAEDFFGAAAIGSYAVLFDQQAEPDASVGQKIGNYRVIREIGAGGMGAVYLAERADGKFRQQVALKMLKREMNTAALRRRFQQERTILASLEHPYIARLLDAGTTGDGIPFLAMEYVEGLPIDEFCDHHLLDLNERLNLFRKVCQAVDFAHRNLVVHRDLKPSNILIVEDGTPKLLDFGISKILSSELEDAATVTRFGAMTPAYASPEQLKNESVTTASDIYSLGVILYELLSGRRPFEQQENDLKVIFSAVIETEPQRPSSVVGSKLRADSSKSEKQTAGSSKQSTTNNEQLATNPKFQILNSKSLRGDLDNIILKALQKAPSRRYSSVENFSEDVRRHQAGLPVSARPATFFYRTGKFIRRHRAGALAGVLIFLAIIGGAIATVWQSRVAQAERDRARAEATKAQKISGYLQGVLNFSNPHWLSSNPKRNRNATVAEAIDEALKNIDTELANEPEIQGEVLFTLGQTYVSQGQFDKAGQVLRKAIENFNSALGPDNTKAMQASVTLGDVLYLTGKFEEAERLYTAAINHFRPKVAEDPSQLKWLAIALNDNGNVLLSKGKLDDAQAIVRESMELSESLTGKDRFALPVVTGNLGAMLEQRGDFAGALNYYHLAQKRAGELGSEQKFEGGVLYQNIGRVSILLKDYQAAEQNLRQSYDILKNTNGEEDVYALRTKHHLANAYYLQGKYREAEAEIGLTLAVQRKALPGHFTESFSQSLLGAIYTKTNRLEAGEREIRQSLELAHNFFKEPNHEISLIKTKLGENLIAQGRFSEAREVLDSALEGYVKTKGENHPQTKNCRELLTRISNS